MYFKMDGLLVYRELGFLLSHGSILKFSQTFFFFLNKSRRFKNNLIMHSTNILNTYSER